jgi:GNAT superfamily N-acetyltransferase
VSLSVTAAGPTDAPAIAVLRSAVAERLTLEFGEGHWSGTVTENGVLIALRDKGCALVARDGATIVGTVRLATKKPWSIDVSHFTRVPKALYLLDMAVAPARQRTGVGRWLMARALEAARDWPCDAVRLDAYEAPAGAGEFYRKCGLRNVGGVTYRGTPLLYYEWVF